MFLSVFTICSLSSLCQTKYVYLKPTNVKLRPQKITEKVKKDLDE